MMPAQMRAALAAHVHMMHYLDTHQVTYREAIGELDRTFPGWMETDGDMWIIEWIVHHTI